MRRLAMPMIALLATTACTDASDERSAAESEVPAQSSVHTPSDADYADVVATIEGVFDALRMGDADLLRRLVDPNVIMHYSERGADGTTNQATSTLDGLATRITTSEVPLIERMWDPEVRVSGDLATLWAPYDFYVGETFSHCGADAATMLRTDDGWRVVTLSWTRHQPPVCALHPEGPPA